MTFFWGDRGHCPLCGCFCGDIRFTHNDSRILRVTGVCARHGEVDLTQQNWSYDDFDEEDGELVKPSSAQQEAL